MLTCRFITPQAKPRLSEPSSAKMAATAAAASVSSFVPPPTLPAGADKGRFAQIPIRNFAQMRR